MDFKTSIIWHDFRFKRPSPHHWAIYPVIYSKHCREDVQLDYMEYDPQEQYTTGVFVNIQHKFTYDDSEILFWGEVENQCTKQLKDIKAIVSL